MLHQLYVLRTDDNAKRLYAFLKQNWRAMANEGKPLSVVITEHKSKRTLEQNDKLHAMLAEIAEKAWVEGRQHSMRAWKEYYRDKFVGVEQIELPGGRIKEERRSTADLNVEEMAKLITDIQVDAAQELGVELSQ